MIDEEDDSTSGRGTGMPTGGPPTGEDDDAGEGLKLCWIPPPAAIWAFLWLGRAAPAFDLASFGAEEAQSIEVSAGSALSDGASALFSGFRKDDGPLKGPTLPPAAAAAAAAEASCA